ncbi:MAG: CARDB domain-containing protein, partial [Candidatus Hydrothermarchaeaceae archaeon]
TVENIGEASAQGVFITDYVPENFEVSGNTETNLPELKPGEKTVLKYTLKTLAEGNYTLKKAAVSWTDTLGNAYQEKSGAIKLEVITPVAVVKEEPAEEEGQGLSTKQAIITALLSLVFLWIIFKLLLISRPVSKE